MTEIYKSGAARLEPTSIVFSEFATRVTLDGIVYDVIKWTTDTATNTRTIEVKPR